MARANSGAVAVVVSMIWVSSVGSVIGRSFRALDKLVRGQQRAAQRDPRGAVVAGLGPLEAGGGVQQMASLLTVARGPGGGGLRDDEQRVSGRRVLRRR